MPVIAADPRVPRVAAKGGWPRAPTGSAPEGAGRAVDAASRLRLALWERTDGPRATNRCMLVGDSRAVWWAGLKDLTFSLPTGLHTPSLIKRIRSRRSDDGA